LVSHSVESFVVMALSCGPIPSCLKLWQPSQFLLNKASPAAILTESFAIELSSKAFPVLHETINVRTNTGNKESSKFFLIISQTVFVKCKT